MKLSEPARDIVNLCLALALTGCKGEPYRQAPEQFQELTRAHAVGCWNEDGYRNYAEFIDESGGYHKLEWLSGMPSCSVFNSSTYWHIKYRDGKWVVGMEAVHAPK